MKILLSSLILIASFQAQAGNSATAKSITASKAHVLSLIEKNLKEETSFNELKDFTVDFEKMKCVDGTASEFNYAPIGVCVADVHAFQILGSVAILLKAEGFSIQFLSVDVD